jgi:hypothetical protein
MRLLKDNVHALSRKLGFNPYCGRPIGGSYVSQRVACSGGVSIWLIRSIVKDPAPVRRAGRFQQHAGPS